MVAVSDTTFYDAIYILERYLGDMYYMELNLPGGKQRLISLLEKSWPAIYARLSGEAIDGS